jgi:hypothetical protein
MNLTTNSLSVERRAYSQEKRITYVKFGKFPNLENAWSSIGQSDPGWMGLNAVYSLATINITSLVGHIVWIIGHLCLGTSLWGLGEPGLATG